MASSLRKPETFDGETFDFDRDAQRLTRQIDAVERAMLDHRWHTLADLSRDLGFPEASISARIRDLRKPRFGEYEIERRYVDRGLWEYRLLGHVQRDLFDNAKEL